MNPSDLLKVVVDPLRLALLGHAAEGEIDVDAVAESMRTTTRRVLQEIGRLRESGLVDADGALDVSVLRDVARQLPRAPEAAPEVIDGPWSADEAEVLGRFFEGSRLKEIPSARAKRLVVLERLVQEFEPGLRYDEREVNFTLQLFHRDYAALRRYLVDEGLMTRADGVYWRTGGRFEAQGEE